MKERTNVRVGCVWAPGAGEGEFVDPFCMVSNFVFRNRGF